MMGLKQMISDLKNISSKTWGIYAIKRDILYRKIKVSDYDELINESYICGKSYAIKTKEELKTNNPFEIAEKLGLSVNEDESKPGAKRLLFASFTTPNKILIMKTPIYKLSDHISKLDDDSKIDISNQVIKNILLSHEIFHFIEQKYKKEIYTLNKKIVLWELFGYKQKSNLRVLSEIAAMSFAQELSGINYSPFILDVLMLYPYNKEAANQIYDDMMKLDKEWSKEDET